MAAPALTGISADGRLFRIYRPSQLTSRACPMAGPSDWPFSLRKASLLSTAPFLDHFEPIDRDVTCDRLMEGHGTGKPAIFLVGALGNDVSHAGIMHNG